MGISRFGNDRQRYAQRPISSGGYDLGAAEEQPGLGNYLHMYMQASESTNRRHEKAPGTGGEIDR